jgi:ligand-binding sensor domain-containing protein
VLDGDRWITYTPYGAGRVASYGADWTTYPPGRGLGDLWVYDIAFDRRGTMWVATWKGLSRFDGSAFETFTVDDGLVDKWVYAIQIDADGALWLGTEGGVNRSDGRRRT